MDSLLLVFLCLVSGGAAQQNVSVWWSPVEAKSPLEGFEVIGGDILVPINETNHQGKSSNFHGFWKDKLIPYEYDKDFTKEEKALIKESMADIQNKTCVVYITKINHKTYVRFEKGQKGCSRPLALSPGMKGVFTINLQAPDCFKKNTLDNLILHATGVHEDQNHPKTIEEEIKDVKKMYNC